AGVGSSLALYNFDIEGDEVLRGPQDLLFGGNVTAGAVVQRTTEPRSTLTNRPQAGVDSGPKFTESLAGSDPPTASLAVQVAVYRGDDSGCFRNRFNKSKFGESSSTRINAALAFTPTDDLRVTGRYSFSKTEGDGPAVQNHGEWS